MAKQKGLGRGLNALIKEVPKEQQPSKAETAALESADAAEAGIQKVAIDRIRRNPWQPRREFDPAALDELVQSVRESGILQPLLVRPVKDSDSSETTYELIAGERRFRSAREADLKNVPVIVMEVSDREALELALVENLQRSDLNLIEEAEGYQALADKFDLTQEQIALRMGKARATVANAMRILSLPDTLVEMVRDNRISGGHAKVLLSLDIPKEQELLARRVVKEHLSVRALEKIVAKQKAPAPRPRAERTDIPASHIQYLSEQLHQKLGTSVRVTSSKTLANGRKSKGSIEIDFYSPDDLDRLVSLLGMSEDF